MANTLRELAWQVRRIIQKGEVSSDYQIGEREVMKIIREVAYKLMKTNWFEMRNLQDKTPDAHFVADFYNQDVKTDNSLFMDYTDLPASYMSLPDNSGVYAVRPMPSQDDQNPKAMIPIQPFDMDIFNNLPAGALEQQWCYEIRRDKIYYHKKSGKRPSEKGITKVIISLASIDPQSVGANDRFPVPPEMHFDLISQTLQVFGMAEQQIKDMVVDDNPNVRVEQ